MRIRPAFMDWIPPLEFGLTMAEEIVLWKLVTTNGTVNRDQLFEALSASPFSFARDSSKGVVKVTISHVRAKMEAYGIAISSTNPRHRGRLGNYSMTSADQRRLRNWPKRDVKTEAASACQKYHYLAGRPVRCGKPSNGHSYCDSCTKASMIVAPKFHGGLKTNRSEAA